MNHRDDHPLDAYFRSYLEDATLPLPGGGWEKLEAGMATRPRRLYPLLWQAAAITALVMTSFLAGYYLARFETSLPSSSMATLTSFRKDLHSVLSGPPLTNFTSGSEVYGSAQTEASAGNTSIEGSGQMMAVVDRPEKHSAATDPSMHTGIMKVSSAGNETTLIAVKMRPRAATPIVLPERQFLAAARGRHSAIQSPSYSAPIQTSQKTKVGGLISPVLAASGSRGHAEQSYTPNTLAAGSGQEKPLMTLSSGLYAQVPVSENISMKTGLIYSRIGMETAHSSLANDLTLASLDGGPYAANTSVGQIFLAGENLVNLGTFATSNSATNEGNILQHLDYVEIPLLLNWSLKRKYYTLSLEAGLTAGKLVHNAAYFITQGTRFELGSTENIRAMLWNASAGVGLEVPLAKRIAIGIQPGYRFSLRSINPVTGYRPHMFGFGTGISYAL